MKKLIMLLALVAFLASVAYPQGNPASWRKEGNKTWFKDFKTYNGIGTTTPTAFLDVAGNTNIMGTLTVSSLPTFTTAAGQITINNVNDTTGVAIAGLTTNAIVIVSYAEAVGAPDTLASVRLVKTGWLTVMGERGKKVNYFIPKK